MHDRLVAFLSTAQAWQTAYEHASLESSPDTDRIEVTYLSQLPTAQRIVAAIDPSLAAGVTIPLYMEGTAPTIRALRQALAVLADMDEVAENLAPDSPVLVANRFHPVVWDAVARLWPTEQYRVAVAQAASALSASIQAKSGSRLTDRELVMAVFSTKPKAGESRLHFPGPQDKTWRSRQEGLHLMAQGAFAGIRNMATHTRDEWPEQEALEHMADAFRDRPLDGRHGTRRVRVHR